LPLPLLPRYPISPCKLTLKEDSGQGGEHAQRSMSCIVTIDCRNKSWATILSWFFHLGFHGKIFMSIMWLILFVIRIILYVIYTMLSFMVNMLFQVCQWC
jgi:hypothetical protein